MVHQQNAATHSSNPASGDARDAAHSFWQSEQIANRVDPYSPMDMGVCWWRALRISSITGVRTLTSTARQYMYVDYAYAGAGYDARFAPQGVAIDHNVPANVRIKRPLVPATDVDDEWSGWRTSGTESGRASCVLYCTGGRRTPLFEVIKLPKSGCQRARPTLGGGCSAR